MTAELFLHGRLTKEPGHKQTGDKIMAWCSMAVSVDCRENNETKPDTLFVSLVCFGKVAERLLRHNQGDMLSAGGKLQLSKYGDKEGFSLVCDTVYSAKTVRPGAAQKHRQPKSDKAIAIKNQQRIYQGDIPANDIPFDDPPGF